MQLYDFVAGNAMNAKTVSHYERNVLLTARFNQVNLMQQVSNAQSGSTHSQDQALRTKSDALDRTTRTIMYKAELAVPPVRLSCRRTRIVLLSKDWFWTKASDDHCNKPCPDSALCCVNYHFLPLSLQG